MRLTGFRLKEKPGLSHLYFPVHKALNTINTDNLAGLVNIEVFSNGKKCWLKSKFVDHWSSLSKET